MDVQDYLIDHTELNWREILAGWNPILPEEFTIWLMNRFGDLFIILPDDSVHLLDVGRGTVEKLADTQNDFCRIIDEVDNADQWLLIPLIDELVAEGLYLKPGECYSYKQSPVLGGEYSVENVTVLPIGVHFGQNAKIHAKIKDIPDGTEISIDVHHD